MSMAELIQATKVYYLTVEGFVTSDPLLLNLGCVAGHIIRERDMYDFARGSFLGDKNGGVCADTLMNGHWEELIGKAEELLHATDHPDNYCRLIQQIILSSSDGFQHLNDFLRLHLIKCVHSMIETMSSSSTSGCASTLVDLQQQLVDRAEQIYGRTDTIVNEAFDRVLSDHPDLHDAVKAQVSVLC